MVYYYNITNFIYQEQKTSIESDFSQYTSTSESESDFDIENNLQVVILKYQRRFNVIFDFIFFKGGVRFKCLQFHTAKEIMHSSNYASHDSEDHAKKKRKICEHEKVIIAKKYYKNCTFNKRLNKLI